MASEPRTYRVNGVCAVFASLGEPERMMWFEKKQSKTSVAALVMINENAFTGGLDTSLRALRFFWSDDVVLDFVVPSTDKPLLVMVVTQVSASIQHLIAINAIAECRPELAEVDSIPNIVESWVETLLPDFEQLMIDLVTDVSRFENWESCICPERRLSLLTCRNLETMISDFVVRPAEFIITVFG